MKVLIKLGGTLLDEPASRDQIVRQLVEAAREYEVVVVHGGGKQVTRFLEERGVPTRFVGGLRVSDEAVIEAVTQVIAGAINKRLVADIIAAGEAAVGLSGVDGTLTAAVQMNPELKLVGKPTKTDGRLLDLLITAGYLPVLACIAGDQKGNIFNVNADQMAVSCAIGWGAAKLLFLTDVPGVKDASGRLLDHLKPIEVAQLIGSGVATGGMQAKLEAAVAAIHGGLSEITIASGRETNVCNRLLAGDSLGTTVALTPRSQFKELQS